MIKIAIVEDSNEDYELLLKNLNKYFDLYEEKASYFRFTCGGDFLSSFDNSFQIVIFDIELPDGNGMDFARKLRKIDDFIPLFFTTNIRQYTLNGYEVNAFNYILKPINYYSLALTLDRVVSYLSKNKEHILEIPTKNGKIFLSERMIQYIEVNNHTIKFHTADNDYTSYGALKNIESSLVSKTFVRINSYAIVNVNHISSIKDGEIYCGDACFRISRDKKKAIIEKILLLMRTLQ